MIYSTFFSTYKRSILLCCAFLGMLTVQAQEQATKETVQTGWFNGMTLGLDVSGPASLLINGSGTGAVKMDVNVRNKYFPTIELGRAKWDKTNDLAHRFQTVGNFAKIGLNLPISIKGDRAENAFLAGIHYGYSRFSYDIDNILLDNYWGSTALRLQDETARVGWLELSLGVRVRAFGPIGLGWTFQYKRSLHQKNGSHSVPSYIPGYGQNTKPSAGIQAFIYIPLFP
ncbi:MAG: DUF6048 family protein [Bacteroidales bacterium]|nr:DUF6048 family protein [Bacteroidales bacterium]